MFFVFPTHYMSRSGGGPLLGAGSVTTGSMPAGFVDKAAGLQSSSGRTSKPLGWIHGASSADKAAATAQRCDWCWLGAAAADWPAFAATSPLSFSLLFLSLWLFLFNLPVLLAGGAPPREGSRCHGSCILELDWTVVFGAQTVSHTHTVRFPTSAPLRLAAHPCCCPTPLPLQASGRG